MTDRFTVRAVVVGLVGALIISALGMIALTLGDKAIPDQLDRLAIGSLGAVAGLLSRTSTTDAAPQPVTVVNNPGDPVPVDPNPGDSAHEPTKVSGAATRGRRAGRSPRPS